jgi:hypothetical protein
LCNKHKESKIAPSHGNQPFCDLYPALFAKEAVKNASVFDRMPESGAVTSWNWNWNDSLTDSEVRQVEDLKELLVGFSLHSTTGDKWKWVPGTTGIFSVKSCYSLLLQHRQVEQLDVNVLAAINKLWRNDVPSKISVFGWRLLLQRLPTRAALNRRGVLLNSHDLSCVFCSATVEDYAHLFFFCPFSTAVWVAVSRWIGKPIPIGEEGWKHFIKFGECVKTKKGGRVRHLIWLATTWNIWKLRNNVIFNGSPLNASSILDDIKTFSWAWFTGRAGRKSCIPFSSWCIDPMACFQSFL